MSSSSGGRGKLVVFSAPSGAGKTSICRGLIASDDRFVSSISVTTRAPRGDEKDGVDYIFLTREEFEKKIAAGAFLEHAVVHGELYGTPRDFVLEAVRAGKYPLLDIDVQGAMQVAECAAADDEIDALLIFVMPPSREELERRLRGRRTESAGQVSARLAAADAEIAGRGRFDFVIVNDDFDSAISRAREIITNKAGRETDEQDRL